MPQLLLRFVVAAAVLVAVWRVADKGLEDRPTFILVTLNGLTLAGLYFVVASGFTLIFGVMRVVNMAHGSFYLLGAYVALRLQQHGYSWWLGLLVAAAVVGLLGLVVEQALLRWSLGQELRQALITIAISVIMADQMQAHFGATPESMEPPSQLSGLWSLHVYDLSYPQYRLAVLVFAVALGLGLWAWIQRTRLGMTLRAGADDRQMVAALGTNIQLVYAVAFLVGALLAGLGGAVGGPIIGVAPGHDFTMLLSSLVVVIIGGMGSLGGAAIGAALLGLVQSYSAVYLPFAWTNYSILFTFALMVIVLALRPYGLFGRPA